MWRISNILSDIKIAAIEDYLESNKSVVSYVIGKSNNNVLMFKFLLSK